MKFPKKLNDQTRGHGFTLVEMLTVVAIIGLLAALLLSAVARAREKGRQISCSSNLRQIGIGIASFAVDNNSLVPFATTNLVAALGRFDRSNNSFGRLSNHVSRSVAIFRCPSDTKMPDRAITNFASLVTITNACSYSIGRRLTWQKGFQDSAIAFDRMGTSTNGFELLSPTNGIVGATWSKSNHRDVGIMLFGDGRVQTHATLPVAIKDGPTEIYSFFHPALGWQYTHPIVITVQNPL